ncbi:MAG TPA: type II secretion system minor pseudopilin GspJ [Rhodanobacteraceae bacterium]|nr:type II secretion system minor pseudopilin GspJ [Rhodanobacteraceae bacterium]
MRRASRGFTLVELLVAVAIFAAASVMAWVGLARIADTRARLAAEQQAFAQVERSVALLGADLGSAARRPIRGADGGELPALRGDPRQLELTHVGAFDDPAQARSALERVAWFLDDKALTRARYRVLDRAPGTTPLLRTLDDKVDDLGFRYLDHRGAWHDHWPPAQGGDAAPLPRAVEYTIRFAGLGDVRRVIELPASRPVAPAADAPS